jgi:Flp pilus assembly protein TadG
MGRWTVQAGAECLRCWNDRRGASAVEFALLAPLFALMLVAVIEIGFEAAARADIRGALRAGAHAAMSGIADPEQIRQITADALEAEREEDIAVVQEYRCGSVTVGADRATCSNGAPVQMYFTISMSSDSMEVRVR